MRWLCYRQECYHSVHVVSAVQSVTFAGEGGATRLRDVIVDSTITVFLLGTSAGLLLPLSCVRVAIVLRSSGAATTGSHTLSSSRSSPEFKLAFGTLAISYSNCTFNPPGPEPGMRGVSSCQPALGFLTRLLNFPVIPKESPNLMAMGNYSASFPTCTLCGHLGTQAEHVLLNLPPHQQLQYWF